MEKQITYKNYSLLVYYQYTRQGKNKITNVFAKDLTDITNTCSKETLNKITKLLQTL